MGSGIESQTRSIALVDTRKVPWCRHPVYSFEEGKGYGVSQVVGAFVLLLVVLVSMVLFVLLTGPSAVVSGSAACWGVVLLVLALALCMLHVVVKGAVLVMPPGAMAVVVRLLLL